MALQKEIQQEDGVVTYYHRILFVNSVINSHVSIAVLSYINLKAREDEKNDDKKSSYKVSTTYETDYSENMTVEDAYTYLKSLPEFEGAEDI